MKKEDFKVGQTVWVGKKMREIFLLPDSTCEVIGNIFDNPELLH